MTKTLGRAEIVNALIKEAGFTRPQAIALLEETLESITASLVKGEIAKIPFFGSFSVRHKSKRLGRNPKTKKEAMISARRTLTFKPSQCLKERSLQPQTQTTTAVA